MRVLALLGLVKVEEQDRILGALSEHFFFL